MFTGHKHAAQGMLCQFRFLQAQFGLRNGPHVGNAILVGLLDNAGQGGEFRFIPRHDNGGAFNQGKIELLADAEIFGIASFHAAEFEAFRRRIKARMEKRAVALGGAGQDIAAAFQQNAFQSGDGKSAQQGKPHHATTDHRNIELLLHSLSLSQNKLGGLRVPVSGFKIRFSLAIMPFPGAGACAGPRR